MIDAIAFVERPAHEIAAGNAVFMKSKDGDVLCLKVQREAKNYVQDYVVRLDPVAEPEMALEFIDPDDPLADCGVPVQFTPEELPGETTYGQHPAEHLRPGVLVDSSKGQFLAVRETTKLHAFVSFVNVRTGMVRRLREHSIRRVIGKWRFDVFGNSG